MICRKCYHMWFNELPMPKILRCPKCGEPVTIEYLHRPRPLIDPSVMEWIIIEDCFHLKNNKGQQILYEYSEKELSSLTKFGYEISKKEDHVVFMNKSKEEK